MPTIETYRKQAKLLVRWHREGNYSIGGRVRQLTRYHSLTDREVLSLEFTLAMAQEIIAIEAGHQNWAELKAAAEDAPKKPRAHSGPPVLRSAIPVLLTQDVKASADFFQEKLGFKIDSSMDCLRFTAPCHATILACTFVTWAGRTSRKPRPTRSR